MCACASKEETQRERGANSFPCKTYCRTPHPSPPPAMPQAIGCRGKGVWPLSWVGTFFPGLSFNMVGCGKRPFFLYLLAPRIGDTVRANDDERKFRCKSPPKMLMGCALSCANMQRTVHRKRKREENCNDVAAWKSSPFLFYCILSLCPNLLYVPVSRLPLVSTNQEIYVFCCPLPTREIGSVLSSICCAQRGRRRRGKMSPAAVTNRQTVVYVSGYCGRVLYVVLYTVCVCVCVMNGSRNTTPPSILRFLHYTTPELRRSNPTPRRRRQTVRNAPK